MTCHAVRTACAQHVSRRQDFRSAASFERHAQAGRTVFNRLYLCAVFDLDSKAFQMLAQDCLGAPLRQATLKFILAPDIGEFRGRDFLQTRAEHLNLPDARARAKKRLDQAAAIDDLQCRWLQCGPASLMVRREFALHDARPNAMTKKFTGRE